MTRKRISLLALAPFLLTLGLSGTANAQYLISSRAGFVNRVEGKVYILRADSEDGEKGRASLGTQMRDGDTLSASAGSFAETLLNPGSYLRLNENAEIRAVNTDLNSVRFELIKGTVIVEVSQTDKQAPIEIVTPQGVLTIAKAGLQRIDAKGSATLVSVRQGEIHLGTRQDLAARKSLKIGRGKVVTLTGSARPGQSDIAKLNEDAADNFDRWSFDRAHMLTMANQSSLRRKGVLTAGWYYDPFYGFYTFIPWRSNYWSPYGFGFFNNYRDCYGYNPNGYVGGYYGGAGSGTVSLPPRVVTGLDRGTIRRSTEPRAIDSGFGSRSTGFGDASSPSRGVSSSPSVSSPTVTTSSPAPSRSSGGDSGGGRAMPSRGRP